METLGLLQGDARTVQQILDDANASLSCEIALAGSLAQRAISREMADALKDKPLQDVDLLLLCITAASPETPVLRQRFNVVEVLQNNGWVRWFGAQSLWYVGGSVHRAIPSTVEDRIDLRKTFPSIPVGEHYPVHCERHTGRSACQEPVRLKWIQKLKALNSLAEIDREMLREEFTAHAAYFASALRDPYDLPANAEAYITLAAHKPPTPRWKDYLFLFWWYCFKRHAGA